MSLKNSLPPRNTPFYPPNPLPTPCPIAKYPKLPTTNTHFFHPFYHFCKGRPQALNSTPKTPPKSETTPKTGRNYPKRRLMPCFTPQKHHLPCKTPKNTPFYTHRAVAPTRKRPPRKPTIFTTLLHIFVHTIFTNSPIFHTHKLCHYPPNDTKNPHHNSCAQLCAHI